MTKKKILSKILTAALTLAMVTAIAVPVAAKETVKITNNRVVMVEGRSYRVLNEGATKYKVSNSKVAKISSKGKITPLKTGYATITVTVKGKKISKKFLFVDKNGTTNSQAKVNKMLAAPNVKTITLKNTTSAKTYTIADGNYGKKTLNIVAPTSKTTVNGDFKNVAVKDSASLTKSVDADVVTLADTSKNAGTVKVNGMVEKLTITSKKVATTVTGTVKNAVVTNGNLILSKDADVAEVSLGGTASLQADTTKKLNVSVVKGSDAKISGSASTNVNVVLQDGAKAQIDAAVKVTVADNAKVEVEFTANAADNGATLVLGKGADAKTTVSEDAKKPIIVTKPDGTAGTVKPGESTENPGGGGTGGGGVVEDKSPTVTASYDETTKKTTYNVSYVTFEDLSSYNVTIKKASKEETFDVTADLVKYVKDWAKDVNGAVAAWNKTQEKDVVKTFGNITATFKQTSPATKKVTFSAPTGSAINGKTITVTVADAKTITVVDAESGYTSTITLTVEGNKVIGVKAVVTNTATKAIYTAEYSNANPSSFTISGDTTKKVIINSVK